MRRTRHDIMLNSFAQGAEVILVISNAALENIQKRCYTESAPIGGLYEK
jgi:hypothetical protein